MKWIPKIYIWEKNKEIVERFLNIHVKWIKFKLIFEKKQANCGDKTQSFKIHVKWMLMYVGGWW